MASGVAISSRGLDGGCAVFPVWIQQRRRRGPERGLGSLHPPPRWPPARRSITKGFFSCTHVHGTLRGRHGAGGAGSALATGTVVAHAPTPKQGYILHEAAYARRWIPPPRPRACAIGPKPSTALVVVPQDSVEATTPRDTRSVTPQLAASYTSSRESPLCPTISPNVYILYLCIYRYRHIYISLYLYLYICISIYIFGLRLLRGSDYRRIIRTRERSAVTLVFRHRRRPLEELEPNRDRRITGG